MCEKKREIERRFAQNQKLEERCVRVCECG